MRRLRALPRFMGSYETVNARTMPSRTPPGLRAKSEVEASRTEGLHLEGPHSWPQAPALEADEAHVIVESAAEKQTKSKDAVLTHDEARVPKRKPHENEDDEGHAQWRAIRPASTNLTPERAITRQRNGFGVTGSQKSEVRHCRTLVGPRATNARWGHLYVPSGLSKARRR